KYPRPTVLWISGQYLTVRDSSVDISATKWGFMPRYPQHGVRFASNLQQEGPNRPIQTPTRRPQASIGGHRVRQESTVATAGTGPPSQYYQRGPPTTSTRARPRTERRPVTSATACEWPPARLRPQRKAPRPLDRLVAPEVLVVVVVAAGPAADFAVVLDELDALDPLHVLEPELVLVAQSHRRAMAVAQRLVVHL